MPGSSELNHYPLPARWTLEFPFPREYNSLLASIAQRCILGHHSVAAKNRLASHPRSPPIFVSPHLTFGMAGSEKNTSKNDILDTESVRSHELDGGHKLVRQLKNRHIAMIRFVSSLSLFISLKVIVKYWRRHWNRLATSVHNVTPAPTDHLLRSVFGNRICSPQWWTYWYVRTS